MSADTSEPYEIRRATVADLCFLKDIELAAARLLAGHAPESVLSETTAPIDFETSCTTQLLWVATHGDRPVGFAQVKIIEPDAVHLDELDVHPDHGRRGLGRRLVDAVIAAATEAGQRAVTLSTFRDVPWNMPFYASMGFTVAPREAWSDALARIVADEQRRGLDVARRVIMRRHLP